MSQSAIAIRLKELEFIFEENFKALNFKFGKETAMLFRNNNGVVVLERYQNKEVCLGNYAIYNNTAVREVYLPVALHHIYNSNFSNVVI